MHIKCDYWYTLQTEMNAVCVENDVKRGENWLREREQKWNQQLDPNICILYEHNNIKNWKSHQHTINKYKFVYMHGTFDWRERKEVFYNLIFTDITTATHSTFFPFVFIRKYNFSEKDLLRFKFVRIEYGNWFIYGACNRNVFTIHNSRFTEWIHDSFSPSVRLIHLSVVTLFTENIHLISSICSEQKFICDAPFWNSYSFKDLKDGT